MNNDLTYFCNLGSITISTLPVMWLGLAGHVTNVGDIQSRLLDHRPVLQGEIRYFVREFEVRLLFLECRLLENLNKMATETNEQILPKCTESMQNNLCDILTRCTC
uniref:Biogenesis of lysosome-related organelles complex 1 subunit 5 n=1 Tax=Astyanax mexicanus TaxID=7994 RepID=A0A8B9KIE2_ASTMX